MAFDCCPRVFQLGTGSETFPMHQRHWKSILVQKPIKSMDGNSILKHCQCVRGIPLSQSIRTLLQYPEAFESQPETLVSLDRLIIK